MAAIIAVIVSGITARRQRQSETQLAYFRAGIDMEIKRLEASLPEQVESLQELNVAQNLAWEHTR
ncbi:hypothetical protein BH24CHL4_BH24CHL4_17070 [soil metagenome]